MSKTITFKHFGSVKFPFPIVGILNCIAVKVDIEVIWINLHIILYQSGYNPITFLSLIRIWLVMMITRSIFCLEHILNDTVYICIVALVIGDIYWWRFAVHFTYNQKLYLLVSDFKVSDIKIGNFNLIS